MGREVVLRRGESLSSFAFASVKREKLYGRKKRLVVDQEDQPCTQALLMRDGSALVPPGGTSSLYIDDDFNVVERKELVAVDEDGELLVAVPSTLGVEQELKGPVSAEYLLDHEVNSVYQLEPSEIEPELEAALEAGDIFEAPFSYRGGTNTSTLFLLKNGEGYFGLIGRYAPFPLLEREVVEPEPEEDEDDPFADDFDFSML